MEVFCGLVFLLGSISVVSSDSCDVYAAVGQSVTLPSVHNRPGNSYSLQWTHNKKIIFLRQQSKVLVGKADDISENGSLLLKNLLVAGAGVYEASSQPPNGTRTHRLCVMEKVSKPQLSYVCESNAVNLKCDAAKHQDLVFSWTQDKKTIPSETRQTLSIFLTELKEQTSFSCSVENKVSKEVSQTLKPTCKSPLLCFKIQTVVVVLAGAAGLIFFLFVTVLVLCCFRRRSKTEMKFRDKGELRMLSLKKRELEAISPDYETMHNIQNSPSSTPKPSPRACYQNVSPSDVQTENRPLQLPTAAEGQQSSPVPKPRTKNAQTLNI
uniref:CD2 molecule n=1 Tax=Iconisemion striatum TaxID=60296 RepID=A0A1A7X1K3_9TELE